LIETNTKYVYGSAAPKIDYNVYEENEVLKRKKVQKSNSKVKLKMVLGILSVFCGFVFLMYRYAIITELNYSVEKASKTYAKVSNENTLLKISIDKNLDLNKVRDIAETKLGMHQPDKFQIVYVKVPKTDLTVRDNKLTGDSTEAGSGAWLALFNKVTKLVEFLD
jgi:cell division protein FtsL